MARHRMPKTRRTHRVMIAAAATAGISSTLVLGHAINHTAANLDVDLAATVLGLGGRGDPLSANVPAKLSGKIAPGWTVPGPDEEYTYFPVEYPADFNFQTSTDAGIITLTQAIAANSDSGIRVTGYSEGALVAEAVKRNLADVYDAENPDDIDFLFIASPYLPNGGIFARFPGFRIPGLLPDFGPAAETPYDSVYVTNEYDTYADFPAYFNPLAIANALAGVMYSHPDPYYDPVDPTNLPAGSKTPVPVVNGLGGTDTYILVYAKHLPLLGPVRQIASILYLTPFTEPVLAAIEPLIRLGVDMGYTDRDYLHPETPTPFSFVTPPHKMLEALLGVPGALQQGLTDAASAGQGALPDLPVTPFSAPENDDQLRVAGAPNPAREADDQVPAAALAEDAGPTTASPKSEPEPEPITRITHPTVTSDGNLSVPTTTVDGGTTPAGDAFVTPISTDPTGTQDVPAQTTEPTAPAGGETEPADNQSESDRAA